VYPILDDEGDVRLLALFAQDITEHKRDKEDLREKTVMLDNIMRSARDIAVATTDLDFRITYYNPTAERFFGYEAAEVVGKTVMEVHTREAVSAQRFDDAIEIVRRTGEYRYSVAQKTADGLRHLESIVTAMLDSEGNRVGFALFAHDVTDRIRAEAEGKLLRSAIEQSVETVVLTDAEGTIQYVNPSFERITGYGREEAIGQNPRMLKSGSQDDPFYEGMWRTLTDGEVWSGRIINRKKDGSLYTEEATISPVSNSRGETVNYVAVKRDITQEIVLQSQLQQAQKMEAIGRLAGGVAHDFNNLLCVIKGNAELVLGDMPEEDGRWGWMGEITRASERAAGLTRQLLTFSRKQTIEPKVIDLNILIESLQSMLARLIGEDIILRVLPQKGMGRVKVDPGQVEQIVLNLAVNARDAMPDGGELTIETLEVAPDAAPDVAGGASDPEAIPVPWILLAVTDTGCGMSAEIREKIFEPFFTTKGTGKGTGLGLATVFGIVEQNGGRIEVRSEPEEGASFQVYFPRVTGAVEVPVRSDPTVSEGGEETVLVVEDEDQVRTLTAKLLETRGYRVLSAASAADAIALAEGHEGPIDLLLTDVIMPHVNGRQLAEKLRGIRPRIKVLYTSGYPRNIIAQHGVLDEGVRFIAKPFSLRELSIRVRGALDEA
jgi:two-component system, cell cycle sensor histidine kinase and response regulator CckA